MQYGMACYEITAPKTHNILKGYDLTYFWPLPPVSIYTFNGEYYEQMFDPSFHATLADHMGITATFEHANALQTGHYQAYLAYFRADIEQRNYQTEKAENRKLQSVADDAGRLAKSLTKLLEFGQCQSKMVGQVANNPTGFTSESGFKLVDILDRKRPTTSFSLLSNSCQTYVFQPRERQTLSRQNWEFWTSYFRTRTGSHPSKALKK